MSNVSPLVHDTQIVVRIPAKLKGRLERTARRKSRERKVKVTLTEHVREVLAQSEESRPNIVIHKSKGTKP